jgi:hypothetical protein
MGETTYSNVHTGSGGAAGGTGVGAGRGINPSVGEVAEEGVEVGVSSQSSLNVLCAARMAWLRAAISAAPTSSSPMYSTSAVTTTPVGVELEEDEEEEEARELDSEAVAVALTVGMLSKPIVIVGKRGKGGGKGGR